MQEHHWMNSQTVTGKMIIRMGSCYTDNMRIRQVDSIHRQRMNFISRELMEILDYKFNITINNRKLKKEQSLLSNILS